MSGVIVVMLSIGVLALVLLPVRASVRRDGELQAASWSEDDVDRYLASAFCPLCGASRASQAVYCGECGAALPPGGGVT